MKTETKGEGWLLELLLILFLHFTDTRLCLSWFSGAPASPLFPQSVSIQGNPDLAAGAHSCGSRLLPG